MTIDRTAVHDWTERIKTILSRDWDPIGQLASIKDLPEDEYQTYADRIASMLHADATEEQLLAYLEWAEVENMGLGPPFDRSRARRVVSALKALGPPPRLR